MAKILASGSALTAEQAEHLRACSICSALARMEEQMPLATMHPEAQERVIAAMSTGLTPVTPIQPAWRYALANAGALGLVMAAGVLMLGYRGWAADSLLQRLYFTVCLGGSVLLSATTVAQLMSPGALPLLGPARMVAASIGGAAAGSLLYPALYYERFLLPVAQCICIGLSYAAVACALTFSIVRRGAFLRRREMISMLALSAGLTGMVVLYVFCPHRDLWHFLLGHAAVPLAAIGIGLWFARSELPL